MNIKNNISSELYVDPTYSVKIRHSANDIRLMLPMSLTFDQLLSSHCVV